MTKRIKVWDYAGILKGNGTAPWHVARYWVEHNEIEDPIGLEVDAWCVGGETGILAYFYYEDYFCVAHGDDGHWWLMYICSKDWARRIKSVMSEVILDDQKE